MPVVAIAPRKTVPESTVRSRGRILVARFVRLPMTCPNCQASEPRWLETTSQAAWVDYYRCDDCGHVWTVSRDGERRITNVTPLAASQGNSTTPTSATSK